MPSERFFNLSGEKRERIIKATANELMSVSYDELSVNKIVKAAAIPRGSFYEYFEDKKDLVNYILEDFKDNMIAKIKSSLENNNGDIFALCTEAIDFCLEFRKKEEHWDILKNVFSCVKVCKSDFFESCGEHKQKMLGEIMPFVNTSLLGAEEERISVLVDMLTILARNEIVYIFSVEEIEEDVSNKFKEKISIIKNGVVNA